MAYSNIGQLDRRIRLLTPVVGRDGIGGDASVTEWVQSRAVWARVEKISGGEAFVDDQRRARSGLKFTIRYAPGITADMRVEYDGRQWNILSIVEDRRGRSIEIDADAVEYSPGG